MKVLFSSSRLVTKETITGISKWMTKQCEICIYQRGQPTETGIYFKKSVHFHLIFHLNPVLGFQLTSDRWPSLCPRGCCGSVNEWPSFFVFQNDHPATDRQAEDPTGQSERIPSQIHTEVFIKTQVLPSVHKRSGSSTDRLMNSAN